MEYKIGISILIVVCTIAAMVIMLIKSKRWVAKQTINEETYVVCYRPVYRVIIAVGVLFFLLLTVAMLLLAAYLSKNEAGMGAEEDIYMQYSCGSYTVERGCFQQGGVVIETSELSDNFSVSEKTSGKVATAAFALFWLTASVLFVFNWKEWSRGAPSYPLLFAAVTLVALAGVIRFVSRMLRKVSVCNHGIRVRNGIGRESAYHIREISAVEEKGSFIILYAGGRRIVKIPQNDSLMAWLKMEFSNVE